MSNMPLFAERIMKMKKKIALITLIVVLLNSVIPSGIAVAVDGDTDDTLAAANVSCLLEEHDHSDDYADETAEETPDAWVTIQEATCAEAGVKARIGSDGNIEETEPIPPTSDHSYDSWQIVAEATCTTKGAQERTCLVCGSKETSDIDLNPEAHVFGNWVITEEATCAESGIQVRICSECGAEESASVDVTDNHVYGEWITVAESTCTAKGIQERICEVCGNKETNETDVNPEAHVFGNWVITEEATCAEPGTQVRVCSECGIEETGSVEATGNHDYGEWETVAEATCITKGIQERTCKICGNIETNETDINPDAHVFDEWVIQENGEKQLVCSACKEAEKTEPVTDEISENIENDEINEFVPEIVVEETTELVLDDIIEETDFAVLRQMSIEDEVVLGENKTGAREMTSLAKSLSDDDDDEDEYGGLTLHDRVNGVIITEIDGVEYKDYTIALDDDILKELLPEFADHAIGNGKREQNADELIDMLKLVFSDQETFENVQWFVNQVNVGGPIDPKSENGWTKLMGSTDVYKPGDNELILYRGQLVTRQDLGNLLYGYVAAQMGFSDNTIYLGAGLQQKGVFENGLANIDTQKALVALNECLGDENFGDD